MKFDAVLIAGPTASGKSAAALALAEHIGGVVINADSMQVYREAPILTAQPDAARTRRARRICSTAMSARARFIPSGAMRDDARAALARGARDEARCPSSSAAPGFISRR